MEIERNADESLGQRALDYLDGVPKVKSPLRMQYAAETKVFRDQSGGLENIRQKLGFSRRKMCQLLLVDPSAWTRWMKDESKVPPHIYRSLEWFLALNEKAITNPDLAAVFLARYKSVEKRSASSETASGLGNEMERLSRELQLQKKVSALQFAAILMLALTCLYQWL